MLELLTPIKDLRRDLKRAGATLSDDEARYLIDYYYIVQEDRKRARNQERSMGEEPHDVLSWLGEQARTIEDIVRDVLGVYAARHKAGRWAQSIFGIGPVISAGLLAHIDITQAPTVGHIWRFAGLDPKVKWLAKDKSLAEVKRLCPDKLDCVKIAEHFGRNTQYMARMLLDTSPSSAEEATAQLRGAKITHDKMAKFLARRPWNAALKTLCWHIGECFVKVSAKPKDIYGKVYKERKEQEIAKNEAGEFADQATAKLERFKIGKTTDAYKAYSAGKLPPAHIHARAKRYAVKLFLSHFHEAMYRAEYGKLPPKPYIIEHGGHVHFVGMPDPEGVF